MKLKREFITQQIGDRQYMVASGTSSFKGMISSNSTAAFIVDCLKEETTPAPRFRGEAMSLSPT